MTPNFDDLKHPAPVFFDRQAEVFAHSLCTKKDGKSGLPETDKPSQLRRFYDHLSQLDEHIQRNGNESKDDKLIFLLPEIRMINAHLAYAQGRKLISPDFCNTMQKMIRAIECPATLHHAKLFFEATLGFLRAQRND